MFVLKWNTLIYSKVVIIHVHLQHTSVYKAVHRYATARTVEWAAWFGCSRVLYSETKGFAQLLVRQRRYRQICLMLTVALTSFSLSCSRVRKRVCVALISNVIFLHGWIFQQQCFRKGGTSSTKSTFYFFLNQFLVIFLCVLALSLLAIRAAQTRPVAFLRDLSFISVSMASTSRILYIIQLCVLK